MTPSGWVDTLGRLIPGSAPTNGDYGATNQDELILPGVPTSDFSNCPTPAASARIWNTPGPNSGTSTFKLCYSDVALSTNFQTPYVCRPGGVTCNYGEWKFSVRMLTGIVLPGLSFWRFDYNNYGDLVKITLPTGGSLSYTWITLAWGTADVNTPVSRTVSSRTVDANDGTGPHTWTYQWATPAGGVASSFQQITVTDPLGSDTVHTLDPVGGIQPLYETKTQFYQGSYTAGTILKTIDTQYSGSSNPYDMYLYPPFESISSTNVVPTSTITTWANGHKSQTTYSYDSGTNYSAFNNLEGTYGTWHTYPAIYGRTVQQTDYDFGNGMSACS